MAPETQDISNIVERGAFVPWKLLSTGYLIAQSHCEGPVLIAK